MLKENILTIIILIYNYGLYILLTFDQSAVTLIQIDKLKYQVGLIHCNKTFYSVLFLIESFLKI